MAVWIVIAIVSFALVAGAALGIFANIGKRTVGFMVALAGGALLVSVVTELIQPSLEQGAIWASFGGVALGATVFAGLDYLIDERWGPDSGGGLLAAITLDGIPENLALGVALIGATPLEVSALAGSIFLSNLPEAAGGASEMAEGGRSRYGILGLWALVGAILSIAALAGNFVLRDANEHVLGFVRCLAAGAVIASLATEVFPKAYKDDHHWAGVATAAGALLALGLGLLAKG